MCLCLPDFCRNQSCTVVHGPANATGVPAYEYTKYSWLQKIQLVTISALNYEPGGRRFESFRARQNSHLTSGGYRTSRFPSLVSTPLVTEFCPTSLRKCRWPLQKGLPTPTPSSVWLCHCACDPATPSGFPSARRPHANGVRTCASDRVPAPAVNSPLRGPRMVQI